LLAQAYRQDGWTVFVVAQEEAVEALAATRERGVRVLIGDAADPAMQWRGRSRWSSAAGWPDPLTASDFEQTLSQRRYRGFPGRILELTQTGQVKL